jgi:hypothetical protein
MNVKPIEAQKQQSKILLIYLRVSVVRVISYRLYGNYHVFSKVKNTLDTCSLAV